MVDRKNKDCVYWILGVTWASYTAQQEQGNFCQLSELRNNPQLSVILNPCQLNLFFFPLKGSTKYTPRWRVSPWVLSTLTKKKLNARPSNHCKTLEPRLTNPQVSCTDYHLEQRNQQSSASVPQLRLACLRRSCSALYLKLSCREVYVRHHLSTRMFNLEWKEHWSVALLKLHLRCICCNICSVFSDYFHKMLLYN